MPAASRISQVNLMRPHRGSRNRGRALIKRQDGPAKLRTRFCIKGATAMASFAAPAALKQGMKYRIVFVTNTGSSS